MHKRYRAAALLMLWGAAMAATAQVRDKSPPTPTINVSVRDGRVSVSPNGQTVPAGQNSVTWWITTSGYRFASGGVSFGSAQGHFSCSSINNGQGVRCTKSDQAPAGEIPYTLQLVDSSQSIVSSDPGIFIQND